MERILYSEISNFIFSLDQDRRGIFVTNAEKLLLFSYNNSCSSDCHKIIIKIYDHSQLAVHQVENATNILVSGIENAKTNMQMELRKEIKSMEKEYITILGIFAAIILAFVGGITFSSSVLENMHTVSIFRLLIMTDFLAFSLINTVHILIHFIFRINEREIVFFSVRKLNIAFIFIAIFVVIGWCVNALALQSYLGSYFGLPWSS